MARRIPTRRTPSPKLPALQFYVGDWRKDPGIQGLDYESRGVWLEILLMMHESEDRGKLLLCGKAMPIEALAQNLGLDPSKAEQVVSKLEAYGVASRDEDTGALINRRMVREEAKRQAKVKAGRLGGLAPGQPPGEANPEATDKQSGSTPPSRTEANGGSSVSVSSSKQRVRQKKPNNYPAEFLAIWAVHPRGAKKAAMKAWREAVPNHITDGDLISALKSYRQTLRDDFQGTHLFRWIRDERWEEHTARKTGNTMTREELDIWET